MKKKTLILQCPGMVCSPPVVSKCLGEAHRRLDIIYIIYITLHYINPFFLFPILLVIFNKKKSLKTKTKQKKHQQKNLLFNFSKSVVNIVRQQSLTIVPTKCPP